MVGIVHTSIDIMHDFHLWLNQQVWVRDNEKVTRREYIPEFVKDLVAFMKKQGYTMCPEWNMGEMVIAQWMYEIHVQEFVNYNSVVNYPGPFHRDWQEDYDEYIHIMNYDIISKFLKKWRLYEDFDPESRVGQRMYEIVSILYGYIDMNASKNGRRIANLLEETDSEEERREDNYIVDAKEGYHGGQGYKV